MSVCATAVAATSIDEIYVIGIPTAIATVVSAAEETS